jgi:hypothetical protein
MSDKRDARLLADARGRPVIFAGLPLWSYDCQLSLLSPPQKAESDRWLSDKIRRDKAMLGGKPVVLGPAKIYCGGKLLGTTEELTIK